MKAVKAYFSDLWRELRQMRGCFRWTASLPWRRLRCDLLTAAALFIVFHQVYFWSGRHLLFSGALFLDNGLFGWDSPRVVHDMLTPGSNRRGHVHPLFVLYARPMALFYVNVLGLTKHTSAIAVVCSAGALAVSLMFALFRAWDAGRVESALFASIFGFGTTPYFMGSIPETGVFSMLSILIFYLLAWLALRRGFRSEWLWLFAGIFTYGTTITNFIKQAFAYAIANAHGTGRKLLFVRPSVYLIFTVALGLGLTWTTGGTFQVTNEKQWLSAETRGGHMEGLYRHMARSFLAYAFVAPLPELDHVTFRGEKSKLVTFNYAEYDAGSGTVALIWLGLLGGGALTVLLRRRPEELRWAALATGCLLFDAVLFSLYYIPFEGVFLWSPHVAVSVFAWTAPLAAAVTLRNRGGKFVVNGALLIFLILQALNNVTMLRDAAKILQGP